MGIVGRLRTGRHLRTLRSGGRISREALVEAKNALVAIGEGALPSLFEALAHREARDPVLEVLQRFIRDETLPKFVDALATPDRNVQSGVVQVLKRARTYDPMGLVASLSRSDLPKARLEAVLQERVKELSPGGLLAMLPDFPREARVVVYRLLEERRDPSTGQEALRLLKHEDWWIRLHMAKLLVNYPGDATEDGLAETLRDSNKTVRLTAVKSLQALKATRASPALVKSLRDADLTVQAAVIDALIEIADASAVPHLVDVLKDESEQARRGAVEVLNEVASAEAIQDLVHALRDADWWVRVRSADALGTIGGEKVVEAILGLMGDDDVHIRRYAVEILNTIPDGRSVPSLIEALRDEDWWVRERSIDALGRTGDERGVSPLLELLQSDEAAAPLCARALGELGNAEAAEPLLSVLSGDPGDELRRETIDALVKIGDGELPPEMRQRMDSALREFGVRLEKTRLRPMEVRSGSASHSVFPGDPPGTSGQTERRTPPPGASRRAQRPPPSPAPDPAPETPTGAPASPDVPLHSIETGTVLLDRYRVIRKVGTGGFSTVFLVEDRVISEELILKILSPHLSVDENMKLRFVKELKLARRIGHPNIIRIHDILEIGKSNAISMEYFESDDLGDVLEADHRLPPDRGVALCRQICEGLGAAHAVGVIHRDIKPANILVGAGERVKIVDFGLAAVTREAENRLTATGHLVGTPHYMAPELIRGEEVQAKADIYSLGVLMYEMFSGRPPYDGDNPMNILFRHLDGEPTPLSELVPDIPPDLERVVRHAMAREPADRPADAAALLQELEEVRP